MEFLMKCAVISENSKQKQTVLPSVFCLGNFCKVLPFLREMGYNFRLDRDNSRSILPNVVFKI